MLKLRGVKDTNGELSSVQLTVISQYFKLIQHSSCENKVCSNCTDAGVISVLPPQNLIDRFLIDIHGMEVALFAGFMQQRAGKPGPIDQLTAADSL